MSKSEEHSHERQSAKGADAERVLAAMAEAARELESFTVRSVSRRRSPSKRTAVPGWVPDHADQVSDQPDLMPESPVPRVRLGKHELEPLSGIFPPDGRRNYTDTNFP